MAINLLGSANANIEYGDLSVFGGLTAMTVAITFKVGTVAAARRLFGQWGTDVNTEQAFLMNIDSTDEVAFLLSHSGAGNQRYGKITTALNVANGNVYRICAKLNPAGNVGAIWANGVSQSITAYVASNTVTVTLDASSTVFIGRDDDSAVDGLDADYAEVAAWAEYVPDWFCEAYGKGYAPTFYRKNLIFYGPLFNTSHLREVAIGAAGTNTAGTDAGWHPSMLYPRGWVSA